jgi:Sulfotransferase domain
MKITDLLIFQAVTDIPAACFAPELMAAYPTAKIILTTRTVASWRKSMLNTIHPLQSLFVSRILIRYEDERTKKLSHLVDVIIQYYFRGSIPANGIEVFEKHNEMVKEIALREKREFLEYRLGDGWGNLCEFLGKDVPSYEFPRVNDTKSFRKAFGLEGSFSWIIFLGVLGGLLVSAVLFKIRK